MALSKKIRESVWQKYECHCSYCGDEIKYKEMQVDHLIPQRNFLTHIKNKWRVPKWLEHLTESDVNHFDNLMPACRVCNKWKDCHDIEQFRFEIQAQLKRLRAYSSNYRIALNYGMILENNKPIVFYFESKKEMTVTIEVIENSNSNCCKALIHERICVDGDFKSTTPFCSNCGWFPVPTLEQLQNAKDFLDNEKS